MELVLGVIVVALVFEFINGFHDTANSIATVVATKVLTPRQAVVLAAVFNLLGALAGTAVASTIGQGLVNIDFVTTATICSGLVAGIIWNLFTWRIGLPSSSSHALIGGLVGATIVSAHGDWSVVKFNSLSASGAAEGILPKVILPMFISPLLGGFLAFFVMILLYIGLRKWKPQTVNRVFGKLQLVSSAWMGYSHGLNDAQKTMGIIALTLVAATKSGELSNLPAGLSFLTIEPSAPGQPLTIDLWIKLVCAFTMAAGTWMGGWRIIKTLGHKMVTLKPVHGFAAETTAAILIQLASNQGIPLSTTHVISSSITGVGAAKNFRAISWGVVERMVWAWIFTLPVCLGLGYVLSAFVFTF